MDVLGVHGDVVHRNEPRLTWRYGNDGRSDWMRPEHATSAIREHIRREFAARVREGGGRRLVEKTPSNALRPLPELGSAVVITEQPRAVRATLEAYCGDYAMEVTREDGTREVVYLGRLAVESTE